jgi:hypothetical protein
MTRVRHLLHTAGLLHVDETTARAEGALTCLHVASNDTYTAMHTGGRGSDDIDAGGVLVDYAGIIVRDGYPGYQSMRYTSGTELINPSSGLCRVSVGSVGTQGLCCVVSGIIRTFILVLFARKTGPPPTAAHTPHLAPSTVETIAI